MDFEQQVDSDFAQFPHEAPGPAPTAAEKRAQKQQQPAPTKAQLDAVEKLSDAAKHEREADEKSILVRRINQYYSAFADRITYKLPRNFGVKQTLEEVKDVLRNVELDLHASGSADYACMLYEQGIGMVQDLSKWYNPLKLALSGPKADLKGTVEAQRSAWVPIMQELAIKYERWFAVGPERRLLFFTASLITQVHRANVTVAATRAREKEPADPNLQSALNSI
jgi:hypothetical protein